jgi:hypothetical protein
MNDASKEAFNDNHLITYILKASMRVALWGRGRKLNQAGTQWMLMRRLTCPLLMECHDQRQTQKLEWLVCQLSDLDHQRSCLGTIVRIPMMEIR